MVGSGYPQRVTPLHALVAHNSVLHGTGECVADVQGAGDVGRGDNEHKRFRIAAHVWFEEATLIPPLVPRCLHVPTEYADACSLLWILYMY